MSCAWFDGNGFALDLETTGPDPEADRVVSCHLIRFSPTGLVPTESRSWLVNPGIPIPPGATAVHGITDAQAAAGVAREAFLQEVVERLRSVAASGLPLVIMNASFDLTLLNREATRIFTDPSKLASLYVLDPRCIDLGLEMYRKGKRKLADLCAYYGVRQDGAHSSQGDALAAARLVWVMAKRWPLSRHTPTEMMRFQREAYEATQKRLAEYAAEQGKPWKSNPPGWPIWESPGTQQAQDHD